MPVPRQPVECLVGPSAACERAHTLRASAPAATCPQDTVLFNDTILHNIRYGNLEATDEQVGAGRGCLRGGWEEGAAA